MPRRRRLADDYDDANSGFSSGCGFGLGVMFAVVAIPACLFLCCGGLALLGLGAATNAPPPGKSPSPQKPKQPPPLKP